MSTNALNPNNINILDRTRLEDGIDNLRGYFRNLVKYDIHKALELVNDEKLHFSSLYVLRFEIAGFGLTSHLSRRNRKALNFINGITAKRKTDTWCLIHSQNSTYYPVLKWILETGCTDDGLSDRYNEILELTASMLTKYYKDSSVLPIIVDMIFKRYRKGLFIHHLAWAFFEVQNPDSLLLIANYMRSAESKDVELACKLLSFIPHIQTEGNTDMMRTYYNVIYWIQENLKFLNYTGESFHHTARPLTYVISRDAKYLCKPVAAIEKRQIENFSEDEKKLLAPFKELEPETRTLLSECSYHLYRRNYESWNIWIHYPITEQIKTARLMTGGLA